MRVRLLKWGVKDEVPLLKWNLIEALDDDRDHGHAGGRYPMVASVVGSDDAVVVADTRVVSWSEPSFSPARGDPNHISCT